MDIGYQEHRSPTHGYAATREAAMAAFAKSWRREWLGRVLWDAVSTLMPQGGHPPHQFDHLVGALEERLGDREAECFRGLEN